MINLGKLRDLPSEIRARLQAKIEEIRSTDWRAFLSTFVDERVRIITAGLSIAELKALLRGEPPTERPNPRYKVHTISFWAHLRPRYYQRAATKFMHTLRLGWFSAFFFVVELITGLFLMIFYTPSPTVAYGDMYAILSNVPFGKFMRDLHRLGAEFMVIVVFLHMLRVWFTGSFRGSRTFTWLTGGLLLFVTFALSFSGYLLPWDQLAYWAVTIGTSMAEATPFIGEQVNLLLRGAPDIGAGGLLRFYLGHVILFPVIAIVLISIHYYKVSREHGISLPSGIEEGTEPEEEVKRGKERVDFIPDLLTHEILLTAIGIFLMVVLVVWFFEAPLEHHADPLKTPLHTTSPWYFLWLQGMLKLGDKTLMGVVLPLMIIFPLLVVLPYIDQLWHWVLKREPSRLARNRKLSIAWGIGWIIVLVILTYMGTPGFGIETPAATEIGQQFIPEEGLGVFLKDPGPVRKIPFDQLSVGTYDSETFVRPASPTELERVFTAFVTRVKAEEHRLPNSQALLIVEDWQEDLKKVTLRILWQRPDEAQPESFETTAYIHHYSKYRK